MMAFFVIFFSWAGGMSTAFAIDAALLGLWNAVAVHLLAATASIVFARFAQRSMKP